VSGGEPSTETYACVLDLLKAHGWNSTSFQILEPGFRYWFDRAEGCIAYVDTGRAWVVAGAPVAARARFPEVTTPFL
jgi:phosphatidylglycerol lysyltransferase